MLKSIKIQIYPNSNQIIYINNLLGSCRFTYNKLLSYRIETYNNTKITLGINELSKYLTYELKNEHLFLKDIYAASLQQEIINLETAYKNFFKNDFGFPKFKSKKNNKNSCRFPTPSRNSIIGNKLTIIKPLKNILFKCSTKNEKYLNKNKDNIRSGTLSLTKSGKYFYSILIDRDNTKILKETNNIIGLDLGIKDFVVTSNNTKYDNIKIIRNNEIKLKKLNRKLSKKQNNSKNKEKCRIKLAKFHNKLNNKKEYYLHSIVNELLSDNQTIVIEDLNVKGMMKNHSLAKSIQELSINRFKQILIYKCNWYNRDLIIIDRYYPSSKLCNVCKTKNDNLELKDREWVCDNCHAKHDRDYNASLNIKNEGIRINNIRSNSKLELCFN